MNNNRIDIQRPDAPPLSAYGPHPVGVQTHVFTHQDQTDIASDTQSQYDRALTVELWYPAQAGSGDALSYDTLIRDGVTRTQLHGQARRDAIPVQNKHPLIVISHGYPGNRYLLSHLAENLASKGYVVVAADHLDSTYDDKGPFNATLYHRPLDQRFVIDAVAGHAEIEAITDTSNVGVMGYSMGGYGALVFAGAGLAKDVPSRSNPPSEPKLIRHVAGTPEHTALIDPRVKAIMPIGPWGMNEALWDAGGLAGLRKPMLMMAGSADDVSDYKAMRQIFEGTRNTTRHLLTFEHAGHNAAAPIPAPIEAWQPSDALDFIPFEHYADAVWDTVRMNNIAQHYATAFMDLHLKGDTAKAAHLDLFEGAQGLQFETRKPS